MIEPVEAFELYARAWDTAVDHETRADLLARAWADDGGLFEPETPDGVFGPADVAAYIEAAHAEAAPGLVVKTTEGPEMVDGRLHARWEQYEEGELTQAGEDVVGFAEDGRISKLTMTFHFTRD